MVAYRVEYASVSKHCKLRNHGLMAVWTGVFFALFLNLVKSQWPEGFETINQLWKSEFRNVLENAATVLGSAQDFSDVMACFAEILLR